MVGNQFANGQTDGQAQKSVKNQKSKTEQNPEYMLNKPLKLMWKVILKGIRP
jgi:hypothetical protein